MADGITVLNVGGRKFTVASNVLPEKMLAQLADAPLVEGGKWLDRDGALYETIIHFLRFHELRLPAGFNRIPELVEEFQRWDIKVSEPVFKLWTKKAFNTRRVQKWIAEVAASVPRGCKLCVKVEDMPDEIQGTDWGYVNLESKGFTLVFNKPCQHLTITW
eukprot:TRINITY_DN117315_c0_g1_i1.p1 TRINITY_DN117315_c0_g1~~TRINITY_DN117315_c0_g1_i1.p1  ORF type:complete len:171 (+),score=3.47 TRINITY_DN117315_c0_g1_i1:33-515(+)